ncbi:hypothetical protein Tco_0648133 [Tanacetum coccineum]
MACAWDTIRTRADIQKLKTQDRLRQWDIGPSNDLNLLRCPLCDLVPDSHDHLFFECAFSSQVWSKVHVFCGMDSIPPRLIDVTTFIIPISKGKLAISILSRLVLAATSYYIWLWLLSSSIRSQPGLVCYWINGRFQATVLFMMGVSGEGCTLFSLSKVFPTGFSLERFFKEADLDRICSCFVAVGLRDAHLILYFNVALYVDDKSTGSSLIDTGMRDFQECVEAIEVSNVNSAGLRFSWNQKPNGADGILKKIGRIMANLELNTSFVGSCAVFQPYRIFDHSLAVLRVPMSSVTKPRPFKFYNLVVHNAWFKEVVANGWMHLALDYVPNNLDILEEEVAYLKAFHDALIMEERFLMQKAKVEWLKLGDANTAYFHKVVKSQASRNHIDSVTNTNGVCMDGDLVPIAFINHYTEFLGQEGVTSHFNSNDLFCNQLSNDAASYMVHDVTDKEIRDAIFSLGDNKSTGPYGYSAAFFKEAWDIIAVDVIKAIKEFFTNGFLLKELNHTIISLIPKVNTPMRINDYRLIFCCNVLFKCISKIISNQMKDCLMDLVDIQKAYDTVDWKFLHDVLVGFGFYPGMIGLIMKCVTSTSFSLSINGYLHGKERGLVILIVSLIIGIALSSILSIYVLLMIFFFLHMVMDSARVIMDSLEEFKNASRLTPSLPKNTAYFCNVLNHVKLGILNILPFEEGKISVKYLGVPLVPSRLLYRDCSELMERVKRWTSD